MRKEKYFSQFQDIIEEWGDERYVYEALILLGAIYILADGKEYVYATYDDIARVSGLSRFYIYAGRKLLNRHSMCLFSAWMEGMRPKEMTKPKYTYFINF